MEGEETEQQKENKEDEEGKAGKKQSNIIGNIIGKTGGRDWTKIRRNVRSDRRKRKSRKKEGVHLHEGQNEDGQTKRRGNEGAGTWEEE